MATEMTQKSAQIRKHMYENFGANILNMAAAFYVEAAKGIEVKQADGTRNSADSGLLDAAVEAFTKAEAFHIATMGLLKENQVYEEMLEGIETKEKVDSGKGAH